MSALTPNTRSRKRGATLVEFALVVPVLIALMIGVMECGWLAKNTLQLSNAVREGARQASLGMTTTAVRTEVQRRSNPLSCTTTLTYTYRGTAGTVVDYAGYNAAPSGALVTVTTTAPHRSLTGFIRVLSNRSLRASATFGRE